MDDWEVAQNLVAQVSGGKVTPGSGNGRLKGDVRTDLSVIEVKQTSQKIMSLQKSWLLKLKKQAKASNCILVIFFELRGYPYALEYGDHGEDTTWKSISLREDSLPIALYTAPNYKWTLQKWSTLNQA